MGILGIFSIAGVMLIGFGALIRFKKTYMIISGISTSTPDRRAKMDLDAICKLIGNGLMIGGLLWIAAGVAYALGFHLSLIILIPVFIIGMLGLAAFAQRYDYGNRDEKGKIKKSVKITYSIIGIAALVFFFFIGGMMLSGIKAPVVTIDGDSLIIQGSYSYTLSKDRVTSVTLTDSLAKLSRTNGFGMGVYQKGHYRNDTHETGRAYLKTDSPPYILMTLDGENEKFLYINLYEKQKTEELYSQLYEWIG